MSQCIVHFGEGSQDILGTQLTIFLLRELFIQKLPSLPYVSFVVIKRAYVLGVTP